MHKLTECDRIDLIHLNIRQYRWFGMPKVLTYTLSKSVTDRNTSSLKTMKSAEQLNP